MSELPNSRSVRRADLNSPNASPEASSDDEQLQSLLQRNLAKAFGTFDTHDVPASSHDEEAAAASVNQPDEFEFQLFSRHAHGSHEPGTQAQTEVESARKTIILRSPTPSSEEPGFLVPRRPDSYYFTQPSIGNRRDELAAAALAGEEIMRMAKQPNPGLFLPWRVKSIKVSNIRSSPPSPSDPEDRRRRPGKKRRIIIRKKFAAERARRARESATQAEKEAFGREKKTRRNREKKLKKKEKDKASKMAKEGDMQTSAEKPD
ncbi:MAG: alpha,alpha-trehalase nth1 [Chaenotheca gracillima]|nr:MAG: alpha,alpha-trehalase nth1 [Chaenotheca gracillima]